MKNLFLSLLILITATSAFAQGKYASATVPSEQLQKTYDIRLFKGVEGTWFNLEEENNTSGVIAYSNILNWLQGRVAGLQVYSYRGLQIPFLRNQPATVFVDEIRVDYSFLNSLSTADIGLVKVMPMPYAAGIYAPGGAIAIYTKRGEAEEEEQG